MQMVIYFYLFILKLYLHLITILSETDCMELQTQVTVQTDSRPTPLIFISLPS